MPGVNAKLISPMSREPFPIRSPNPPPTRSPAALADAVGIAMPRVRQAFRLRSGDRYARRRPPPPVDAIRSAHRGARASALRCLFVVPIL
ncbi:hypothetical protein WS70_05805 [Burkholderia mayonis]|uniref:Uncharacterized protein n=1 Tax=Burkholderia mayonis TaxID=1385591 RepID=A0A1B4FCU1_9BURK|nr:hypothetical protein WS70_05805 [Burkholderia mayonis]KVE45517.1 hypothetical protein WS69_18515 [Burkholderia sp. BDU5]KVE46699.1 hypothetical protein WS70_01550 [Burkholderia mayonis]